MLTEKDTLKKILEQGLGEEYMQHKDKITHFFHNMQNTIKMEHLTFIYHK